VRRREARTIWPGLDCPKSNPQWCKLTPVGMTFGTGGAVSLILGLRIGDLPDGATPASEAGRGDESTAYVVLDTYSGDVPRDRLQGASPMVTEWPVVVAGVTTRQGARESREQGEGAQVFSMDRAGRDA
jgi:hypothetical protein